MPTEFISRRRNSCGFTKPAQALCTVRMPTPSWAPGLMNLRAARRAERPVHVALGSDVGGGTRLSMLCNMAEAFKVAQLRGETLDPFDLFHMATRGGAIALGLEDRIGNLTVGMEADMVVLDTEATGMLRHRSGMARDLGDILFALLMLGDERAVRETWVAGQPVN